MRWMARTLQIAVVVGVLLATTLVVGPAALSQSTLSDDRVDFGGVNGLARGVIAVGNQVWVGGEFSQAFDADPASVHPRQNLAIFDFTSGDVFAVTANANAEVEALESDRTSTVWAAGDFTEIAGEPVTYIAAFDAHNGQLLSSFSLTVDNGVNALDYHDGWLYVGGDFDTVNGLAYKHLVRVDAYTGELDLGFRPEPNEAIRSVHVYGDRAYAAGLFDEVGDGIARQWVAGFDVTTGEPSGPTFDLLPPRPNEASHRLGVALVQASPDGQFLYTGDRRNVLTQWDRLTGESLRTIGTRGDLESLAVQDSVVYASTHDGLFQSGDEHLLFAVSPTAGQGSTLVLDPGFAPLQNSFFGTHELDLAQHSLISVGEFTTVNGVPSPRVAVFRGPDWPGAAQALPGIAGDVNCDRTIDLGDALVIAQFSVGVRSEVGSCLNFADALTEMGPGGDADDDGFVNLGDALLVAQCSVGIPNQACP